MRTIIALPSLGLALALSDPVSAAGGRDRPDHIQTYYEQKRQYRQSEGRTRGERANTDRKAKKPAITPKPPVFRGPVPLERPQIAEMPNLARPNSPDNAVATTEAADVTSHPAESTPRVIPTRICLDPSCPPR